MNARQHQLYTLSFFSIEPPRVACRIIYQMPILGSLVYGDQQKTMIGNELAYLRSHRGLLKRAKTLSPVRTVIPAGPGTSRFTLSAALLQRNPFTVPQYSLTTLR